MIKKMGYIIAGIIGVVIGIILMIIVAVMESSGRWEDWEERHRHDDWR